MAKSIRLSLTLPLMMLTVGHRAFAEARAAGPPPTYEISRAGGPITIDGRLDEPAWVAAPDVGAFHFPWFKKGQKEQTVAKMLWNDEHLYIAHICQDAHITARYSKHDDPIPEDDCFEVMMLPDPARPNSYYNVEWNLLGGYVDGHRPEGAAGPRAPWDVQGLRVAGSHVGTLNDDDGRDKYWLCEVAIPLENFAGATPKPGDEWRLNLNRHGGAVNMQYSQWSPAHTLEPAFHTPETFGRVIFSAKSSPFALHGEEAPLSKGPKP